MCERTLSCESQMENQGCPSLGVQKEERSPSEGSCSDSECSCEACCNAESGEESAKKLELNLTGMKDATRDAFHAPVVVEGICILLSPT